jgi:DNA-binding transcriptional LysR family regulator
MMIELELATNEISGTNDEISGELTIATTHGYASTVLFPHLCNFSLLYPEITLHVMCDDMDLDLIKKEADVAVRPYDIKTSELEHIFLHERKLQLFASQEYIDKMGIPEKTEDLDFHRLIVFENPNATAPFANNTWNLTLGMIDGQKRKPFMTVNSAECLAHAAEQGIGIIACSHDSLLLKKYALKRVLPTIEGQPTKMYYVYPKSIRNLSTVGLLGNYLKNALSFPQNITN